MKKGLFLTAVLLIALTGAAAQPRVQYGVRAGVFSQDLVLGSAFDGDTDAKMGFNVAAVSRVRLTAVSDGALGLGLFLQPEIIYSQNIYKMQPEGGNVAEIKMQSVDIPVLLSVKVNIIRVQLGPVFNVMYKNNAVKGDMEMIPQRPSVGYSVGASVDIFGGIVLDGRYNGQFRDLKNNIKSGDTVYHSVKGSLSSWSVGLSFLL